MKRAIVAPAVLAPSALAELKDWLGITRAGDDAQLTTLLRAALDACEDFTGLMPLQQSCSEVLRASGGWEVLATSPVQAITAVTGLVADGSSFVFAANAYQLELDADGGGRVRVAMPGAAGRVLVNFVAGLSADWPSLPDQLRHGMMRLAAQQYHQREDDGAAAMTPPAAVAALWRPWRKLRII